MFSFDPICCSARTLVVAALLGLPHFAASGAGAPRTEIRSVSLDGEEAQLNAGGTLRIPNGTRDVRIWFASSDRGAEAVRVRYRLQGFDSEWLDPPSAMRAVMHFQDAQGLEVGAAGTSFTGTSRGWQGNLETSTFAERAVEATAPPRTVKAYVEFVSGGTDTTLGVYAIRRFRVRTIDGAKAITQSFPLETGVDMDNLLGTPTGWLRQGSNPAMALLMKLKSGPALALCDVESRSYCAWRTAPQQAIVMSPGTFVAARWDECYAIGAGGPAEATYRYLRPGSYVFQCLAVTPEGQPLGLPVELSMKVLAPWWQEPRTWLLGILLFSGLAALAVRRFTQQRLRRRLADAERRRALEGERARIAQDIHDDLGAGLAQIAMLSELAQNDGLEAAAVRAHLDEIYTRAHAAGRALDEIVWAINPAHDSAEDLVGYLARFTQDYLHLARIRFRLDVPASLPEIRLTSGQRHQIFLAAKEAIHNAARHSSANEIILKVRVENGSLSITVRDDGCGFTDTEKTLQGRGSASMRARMEKIGGQFQRCTSPGLGASINLVLFLNQPSDERSSKRDQRRHC